MSPLHKGDIVHVSGDSADLWIQDYNVRVNTDARVDEDPKQNSKKVLVTLFSIDGDVNVTTYVRRSRISPRDEDYSDFFPGGAHACAQGGVKKICGNGCIAGFSCGHPRTRHIRLFGQETTCPLEKYNITDVETKIPWFERKPVTEDELMAICVRCDHAIVKESENGLSAEYADFARFCIDCPVVSVRDSIAEAKAEARGG